MSADPQAPISSDDLIRLSRDPRFRERMAALYAELDAQIVAHGPACWNRGLCCNFGRTGHRLYVTALELIYFAGVQAATGSGLHPPAEDAATCPYQVDGLCTVRDTRPIGCRVYFCQASSRWWQGPMTESWLARLKALHEEFDVPYAYVEWLAGLRSVGAD
jgi:hypothetical protein